MIAVDGAAHRESVRYPCTLAQERLYAASRRRPDDPALNASMRWRVRGELSQAVLDRAWRALVSRHEMLRTRFAATADGVVQIVEPAAPVRVSVVDCSALDPEIVEAEIARIAATDARAPFDVAAAPLIRVTRLVLGPQDAILLVTAHLLVCDGWSYGLLARELGVLCDAFARGREPDLAPPATTFGAFARWQREALTRESLAEELALLRGDFAGDVAVEIPTDRPRPARWSSRVASGTRVLDATHTKRFLDDARASGSTPFMAMLGVAAVVLRERAPQRPLAVSTNVVGRDDVDLEGVVGPLVDSMPLRLDFAAGASLSRVIATIADVMANAFELRHVPFALIADDILPAVPADRGAPCAINFLYQKAFTQDVDYGAFRIASEHSRPGGTPYDLSLYVVERPGGWRLSCDYNPDLFLEATIGTMLDRFEAIVAGGIDRREPVLFFHSDLFADGFYAEEIAAQIVDRRVIPIGPHGIGDRPLLRTIDAMARDYVEHLATIQAAGPYRLVGFCAGALVAFEVARLLRERGECVEDVILINATAPAPAVVPFRDVAIRAIAGNARLQPRVREALCYNIARLNRALVRGPAATATFLRNLVAARLGRRGGGSDSGPETFVRTKGDATSELSFAHIGAALSHRPHAYDGDVTLIWSTEQTNLTGDATQGWHRLARSVRVVDMRGGHVAPLHELVGDLLAILTDLLATRGAARA